jgi:hypothetical protein
MTRRLMLVLLVPSLLAAQRDTAKAREAYLTGRQAMRDKRTGDAIHAFERAVELNDRSSEYFVWLGHAHTRDIAKANFMRQGLIARRIRTAYDRAVELDSSSVPAAEARVEFYANAPGIAGGGMDKARAEAARLKKLDAWRGEIWLGFLEEREHRYAAAEALYQGVVQSPADSSTRALAEARLKNVRAKIAATPRRPDGAGQPDP